MATLIVKVYKSCYLPLLAPSGPLKMVHSSILPKGWKSWRTSSSVCCLLSIPTNNLRSSEIWQEKLVVVFVSFFDRFYLFIQFKYLNKLRCVCAL